MIGQSADYFSFSLRYLNEIALYNNTEPILESFTVVTLFVPKSCKEIGHSRVALRWLPRALPKVLAPTIKSFKTKPYFLVVQFWLTRFTRKDANIFILFDQFLIVC